MGGSYRYQNKLYTEWGENLLTGFLCWKHKKPKNKPSLRDSALDGEKNGETVEQNVVVLDKDSRRRRIRALETKCDVI